MRRLTTAVTLLVLWTASNAAAQTSQPTATAVKSQQVFHVKSTLLSLGLIGGGTTASPGTALGLGASLEVGAKQLTPDLTLGLGGIVGYTYKIDTPGDVFQNVMTTTLIAATANVHFKMEDQPKLDLYGGLSLASVHHSYSDDYPGTNPYNPTGDAPQSSLALGVNLGGRFDFKPKVAGLLQLTVGSHVPRWMVGATFKW